MKNLLTRARKLYRDEGRLILIKRGYQYSYNNYLRQFLPRQTVTYNGVSVRASHLGDQLIPWQETDVPGYENALVRGIRKYVENSDTVVVVGGGWGVSTVASASQSGECGRVITYEGGEGTVEKVRDTVQLNGLNGRVSVRHAIVGHAISLRDDGGGAKVVSPAELPECDVLVLDCEGAEKEIIEEMEIQPRAIIVETHGIYGSPSDKIEEILTDNSYNVKSKKYADDAKRGFCKENDIHVLSSIRLH